MTELFKIPDTSHWSGLLDVKKSRPFVYGIIAKTSESNYFLDSQWVNTRNSCVLESMPYSGYHFYRCDIDPTEQAKWFISCLGSPTPLVVWDDIETTTATLLGIKKGSTAKMYLDAVDSIALTYKNKTSLSTTEAESYKTALALLSGSLVDNTLTFLNYLKSKGFKAGIYTSPGFADAFFTGPNKSKLADFWLWVAHIGVTSPTIPAPWDIFGAWDKNKMVVLWQYSWTETVPGFPEKAVDMNYLSALAGEAHVFFGNGSPYVNNIEIVENKLIIILVDTLRVRKAPSTSATTVDYVYKNNVVVELEEKVIDTNNVWARVGINQWVAKKYQGNTYATYKTI